MQMSFKKTSNERAARCVFAALFCCQLSCDRAHFWNDTAPDEHGPPPAVKVKVTDCEGASAPREQVDRGAPLLLDLNIRAKRLNVRVMNDSKTEVRIFEWFNSWGYFQYKFHVKNAESERAFSIERKVIDFEHRNAPGCFTLAPQECKQLSFELDESWIIPNELLEMRKQPLLIQAELLSSTVSNYRR